MGLKSTWAEPVTVAGPPLYLREASESNQVFNMNGQLPLQNPFEAIVNTVREPLVVLDGNLGVRIANRSFYRTFRVCPNETEHRPLYELGNGQWNIPALRNLLEQVMLLDCHFEDFEVDHKFPLLGRRVMLLNARQVKTAENTSGCILLAIEDITDRKLRDELMRDLNGKLMRSNRELQDFAQVASHDLQEPLRKIQWFGDRLGNAAGPVLNDACRGYLERMLNAASRMQLLINDLLMFSRIETKARPFVRTSLRLIASEVVRDLETQIQRTGAAVQIQSDLPTIEADPLQMRQLLQNLISNALKYHKPDRPPLVIVRHELVRAALPDGGAGTLCHLMIEDNGIGFDEKYLDRIFDVFQRLHAKAEYEGTGIGLAVCRKIAERHGGSITAKSEPGAGAKFIVTLPRDQKKQE